MKFHLQLIILTLLVPGLAACHDSGEDDNQNASQASQSTAALFDRDMSKRGCEILTADLVSATFDVPADALKQMKIMGCRYEWSNDEQTLTAGITMLRAYKSEAAAAGWFANATRNRTAKEMQQEMDKISGQLDESEQLDTELKKSTAKNLLAMVENKAVNFEDVEGIGDEARVRDSGTVYVRVDNLTFMVTAYKGSKMPKPDMQGVDLKQLVAITKENAARWAIETAPQRKNDGIRLARVIVDNL